MTQDADAPSVRAITCPSCGGSLELRAAGFSTHFVCQYCGSELDLVDPEVRLISEHAQAAAELDIPLGSRGVLRGVEWAAIGYLERSDGWGRWSEYLLFNPYHGYRWLSRMAAGWSFGAPLMTQPGPPRSLTQAHDGRTFKKCFAETTNTVEYVLGEFYWQVRRGDETVTNGYVSGDRMLSCEITADEYEWTLEEWIASSEVAKAFGVEDSGQYPATGEHPLPHQPNPHNASLKFMAAVAAAAFLLALVFVLVLETGGPRAGATIEAGDAPASRQATIGPFTITGRPRPFIIETRGEPGNNSWLDVEYELTNLDPGVSRFANQPIEYYYGTDWTEDNRSGTLKLSAVPPGRYELSAEVIRPEDERGAIAPRWTTLRQVRIDAGPGGVFWSNLVLLFFALFIPVAWVFARVIGFEATRQSDYDYGNDDDDDE